MTIDPISDMLVTIRNGIKARHVEVRMPASNLKSEIARVLKDAGYIENYITSSDFPKALVITLKYTDGAESAIRVGVSEIPAVLGGMGLAVLSTSKGVMSGKEAKAKKLGGELICTVW